MSGYVDLHCHYLPGIDDGVRTVQEGVELCRGLRGIGFERVIATPHMRTAIFDNDRASIEARFESFRSDTRETEDLPELSLASEHFFDDVFYDRFRSGGVLPYPGGHAILVELPPDALPLGLQERCFELSVRRVRPVLAHPERYAAFFRESTRMDPLLDQGVLPLLDVMSLVGHYGRAPERAAERMLDEGVYFAACTDCHRPSDVAIAERAIERLRALVGAEEARELLRDNPERILTGRIV